MSFVHFLAFNHFKKRRAISLLFFFLFYWGCANDFTKRELKYVFSPFPSRMNFLEMSRLVLCVLISLFIFLFALFMTVKLDSIKTFLYKESFAASELKRSAKRVILRTKRNPFLEAKVLSPAWNLFFPQHSRRCWRPRTERITWNSRKQRWEVLLFEAFICMAWRE